MRRGDLRGGGAERRAGRNGTSRNSGKDEQLAMSGASRRYGADHVDSGGGRGETIYHSGMKKRHRIIRWRHHVWSRWQDSNLRPLGYEPNELTAAPHRNMYIIYYTSAITKSSSFSNFFGIARSALLPRRTRLRSPRWGGRYGNRISQAGSRRRGRRWSS